MRAKIAWIYGPGSASSKTFWLEELKDSQQYTIEEIAKEHDLLYLVPVMGRPHKIGFQQFYISTEVALSALRKFDPDIINLALFGSAFNGQIATEFQKSFITLYDYGGNLFCPYSKHIDVFFTNQELRRKEIILKNRVSPEKVIINPYGVDHRLFYPDDSVEKTYTGIMVADFRRRKQQHVVINNWVDVEGKLLLVGRTSRPLGDAGYVRDCKRLIEILGLSERVEIRNFVPHDELPRIINSAEIGIRASKGGAGGRAASETMACGLPTIVLKNELNEEWVKSGGIMEVDPDSIGTAVNRLKNNPDEYKKLREGTLRTIKPYTYARMLATYRKVFEEAHTTC